MAKILFVKGTPQTEEQSRSMQVARTFIDQYLQKNPTDEVIELDLYQMNVPLIDADVLNAWNKLQNNESITATESQKIEAINELTDQFIAADKCIFQSSLWNLGIQPLLKAYFDTILVAGKTFKYTEKGSVGLMQGKKAIHIFGSGGTYSNTTGIEHSDSYIKGVLGFIGCEVAPTIFVEGIDDDPSQKEEIMTAAKQEAQEAAKKF